MLDNRFVSKNSDYNNLYSKALIENEQTFKIQNPYAKRDFANGYAKAQTINQFAESLYRDPNRDPREEASAEMLAEVLQKYYPNTDKTYLRNNYKTIMKSLSGYDLDAKSIFEVFGNKVASGYSSMITAVRQYGHILGDSFSLKSEAERQDSENEINEYLNEARKYRRTDYFTEYDKFLQKCFLDFGDILPSSSISLVLGITGALAAPVTGGVSALAAAGISGFWNGLVEAGNLAIDLHDAGVSNQTALKFSTLHGITAAILEGTGDLINNKFFEPLGNLITKMPNATGNAMARTIKELAKTRGEQYLTALITEPIEEALQDFSNMYIYNLALEFDKNVRGQDIFQATGYSRKEIADAIKETVKTTFRGQIVGGLTNFGVSAIGDVIYNPATQKVGNLKGILEARKNSKMTKNSKLVQANAVLTNKKAEKDYSNELRTPKVREFEGVYRPVQGDEDYVAWAKEKGKAIYVETEDNLGLESTSTTQKEAQKSLQTIASEDTIDSLKVSDKGEIVTNKKNLASLINDFTEQHDIVNIVKTDNGYDVLYNGGDVIKSQSFVTDTTSKTTQFTQTVEGKQTEVAQEGLNEIKKAAKNSAKSEAAYEKDISSYSAEEQDVLRSVNTDIQTKLQGTKRQQKVIDAQARAFTVLGARFAKAAGKSIKEYFDNINLSVEELGKNTILGNITVDGNGKFLIKVSKNFNSTTLAHELSHSFLSTVGSENWENIEGFKDIYAKEIAEDIANGDSAYTKTQEKFATDFEKYLRSGSVSNKTLNKIFNSLKLAAQALYELLGGDVNQQTKDMFDRLLSGNLEVEAEKVNTTKDKTRKGKKVSYNQEISIGSILNLKDTKVSSMLLDKYVQAIEMNKSGAKANDIVNETGWQLEPDGHWYYYFVDTNLMDNFRNVLKKEGTFKGKTITLEEYMKNNALSIIDEYYNSNPNWKDFLLENSLKMNIKDFLEDNRFYEMFPETKNFKFLLMPFLIDRTNTPNDNQVGFYTTLNGTGNYIVLNLSSFLTTGKFAYKDMAKAFEHEYQHAVQLMQYYPELQNEKNILNYQINYTYEFTEKQAVLSMKRLEEGKRLNPTASSWKTMFRFDSLSNDLNNSGIIKNSLTRNDGTVLIGDFSDVKETDALKYYRDLFVEKARKYLATKSQADRVEMEAYHALYAKEYSNMIRDSKPEITKSGVIYNQDVSSLVGESENKGTISQESFDAIKNKFATQNNYFLNNSLLKTIAKVFNESKGQNVSSDVIINGYVKSANIVPVLNEVLKDFTYDKFRSEVTEMVKLLDSSTRNVSDTSQIKVMARAMKELAFLREFENRLIEQNIDINNVSNEQISVLIDEIEADFKNGGKVYEQIQLNIKQEDDYADTNLITSWALNEIQGKVGFERFNQGTNEESSATEVESKIIETEQQEIVKEPETVQKLIEKIDSHDSSTEEGLREKLSNFDMPSKADMDNFRFTTTGKIEMDVIDQIMTNGNLVDSIERNIKRVVDEAGKDRYHLTDEQYKKIYDLSAKSEENKDVGGDFLYGHADEDKAYVIKRVIAYQHFGDLTHAKEEWLKSFENKRSHQNLVLAAKYLYQTGLISDEALNGNVENERFPHLAQVFFLSNRNKRTYIQDAVYQDALKELKDNKEIVRNAWLKATGNENQANYEDSGVSPEPVYADDKRISDFKVRKYTSQEMKDKLIDYELGNTDSSFIDYIIESAEQIVEDKNLTIDDLTAQIDEQQNLINQAQERLAKLEGIEASAKEVESLRKRIDALNNEKQLLIDQREALANRISAMQEKARLSKAIDFIKKIKDAKSGEAVGRRKLTQILKTLLMKSVNGRAIEKVDTGKKDAKGNTIYADATSVKNITELFAPDMNGNGDLTSLLLYLTDSGIIDGEGNILVYADHMNIQQLNGLIEAVKKEDSKLRDITQERAQNLKTKTVNILKSIASKVGIDVSDEVIADRERSLESVVTKKDNETQEDYDRKLYQAAVVSLLKEELRNNGTAQRDSELNSAKNHARAWLLTTLTGDRVLKRLGMNEIEELLYKFHSDYNNEYYNRISHIYDEASRIFGIDKKDINKAARNLNNVYGTIGEADISEGLFNEEQLKVIEKYKDVTADENAQFNYQELMGILIYSNEKDGLVRLMQNNRISAGQIAWVRKELSEGGSLAKYGQLANAIQKEVASRFKEIAYALNITKNQELFEVENYFPFINENGQFDFELLFDENVAPRVQLIDSFTKARSFNYSPLNLDVVNRVQNILNTQEKYIAGAETFQLINSVWNGENGFGLRAIIENKYGTPTATLVQNIIDANKHGVNKRDIIDKTLSGFLGNRAVAKMSYNISSVLQQPATLFYGLQRCKLTTILSVMNRYKWFTKDGAEALNEEVLKHSSIMYSCINPDIEITRNTANTWKNNSKIGKAANDFVQAGMSWLEKSDKYAKEVLWLSAYEEMVANNKDMDEADIIRDVDEWVLGSQSNSNPLYNSYLYSKDNALLRYVLMFTNQLNKQYNMVTDLTINHQANNIFKTLTGLSLSMLWVCLVTGKWIPDKGSGDDDEETLLENLLKGIGTEALSMVPIAGSTLKGWAEGYVYGNSDDISATTAAFVGTLFKKNKENAKTTKGQKLWTTGKNVLYSAEDLAGLPSVGTKRLIQGLELISKGDYMSGVLNLGGSNWRKLGE